MELYGCEIEVLQRITGLLRTQGELLLNGNAYLSLSANTVITMNASFERIRETDLEISFDATPANSAKIPFYSDIQRLYDFTQKLVKLKVTHKDTSLPGRISLAPFRRLCHLELKGVPLHLVTGITQIRSHLQSLTCVKCLPSLKNLFESCGGDQSEASLSWHDLHSVYLRNNKLLELDNSLRLVPMLSRIDVSHNSITATEDHLQFLTELVAVNMSFNRLKKIPRFALSSQSRLRVLLLKYNSLISIEGLQELTGLHELDLTGNLIAAHQHLKPLLTLAKLKKLWLKENPIGYHKQHRRLSVACLHALCLTQIILDDAPLSKHEIKYHGDDVTRMRSPPPHGLLVNGSDLEQSMEVYDGFCTSAATSQSESEVKVVRERKKKGKGKKKARKANICDMSDTCDAQSLDSAKASYTDEEQKIKENIERMRNEMGPDWLQALQQHIPQGSQVYKSDSIAEFEQHQENRDVQIDAVVTPVNSEHRMTEVTPTPSAQELLPLSHRVVTPPVDEKMKRLSSPNKSLSPFGRVTPHCEGASPHGRTTPGGGATPGEQKVSRPTSSTSLIWQSSNEQQHVDYGTESEPFIVCRIEDPTDEYIITVSDRYVLEKDINGEVTEELDLKCLLDVSTNQQRLPALNNDVIHCVRMTFDYVNKHKRDRQYIMEDKQTTQALCELLVPSVQANLERTKLTNKLQCLKCNHEFMKSPLRSHKRNSSYGGINRISSLGKHMSQLSHSLATDIGAVEDGLVCPKCGSDLVIEVEPQPLAASDSNYTTPVGSLTTQTFPLATSSTLTTPIRGKGAGSSQKKVMPWEFSTEVKTSADVGEASSFKSCATDLSQSYRSLKEAVLAASNNTSAKAIDNSQFYDAEQDWSNESSNTPSPTHTDTSKREHSPAITLPHTDAWLTEGNLQNNRLQDPMRKSISQSGMNQFEDDLSLRIKSEVTMVSNDSSDTIGFSGSDLLLLNSSSRIINSAQKHADNVERQSGEDLLVLKNPSAERSSLGYVSGDKSSYKVARHTDSDLEILQGSLRNDTALYDSTKYAISNINTCDVSICDKSETANTGIGDSIHTPYHTMQSVHRSSNTQYSDQVTMAGQLSPSQVPSLSKTNRRVEEFEDKLDMSEPDVESSTQALQDTQQEHVAHEGNLSPIHEHKITKSKSNQNSDFDLSVHSKQGHDLSPLTRRQSSDIEVLNDDSPVLKKDESETAQHETNGQCRGESDSVYGLLTEGAVHNMVDYMRSSIYDKDDEDTDTSNHDAQLQDSVAQEAYNFDDFSQIDHRLKLHLMMNVFADDLEEFQLIFRCGVVQYTKGVEYEGLLVASNSHLYIFTIVAEEKLDRIDSWLKLLHSQHLTHLRYVDIGLGYQSFRLQFGLEATCFDFLVRDELQCKTFIAQFTVLLQGTSFTATSQLQAISKNNPESMQSLQECVINVACDVTDNEEVDSDVALLKFVKCYMCSGKNDQQQPVCVAVTRSHICFAEENYKVPLPKITGGQKGRSKVKEEQFKFLQTVDITDVCRLELPRSKQCDMKMIYSCDEDSNSVLTLSFVTERSKHGLIEALQTAYHQQLEVDLDVDPCT